MRRKGLFLSKQLDIYFIIDKTIALIHFFIFFSFIYLYFGLFIKLVVFYFIYSLSFLFLYFIYLYFYIFFENCFETYKNYGGAWEQNFELGSLGEPNLVPRIDVALLDYKEYSRFYVTAFFERIAEFFEEEEESIDPLNSVVHLLERQSPEEAHIWFHEELHDELLLMPRGEGDMFAYFPEIWEEDYGLDFWEDFCPIIAADEGEAGFQKFVLMGDDDPGYQKNPSVKLFTISELVEFEHSHTDWWKRSKKVSVAFKGREPKGDKFFLELKNNVVTDENYFMDDKQIHINIVSEGFDDLAYFAFAEKFTDIGIEADDWEYSDEL